MKILFSKLHERAIFSKSLKISIPNTVRQRILYLMKDYSETYQENWEDWSNIFPDDLFQGLIKTYGTTDLRCYKDDKLINTTDMDDFILGGYPGQIFDAIEFYPTILRNEDSKLRFIKDINLTLIFENLPYRVLDGRVIIIDSAFLESEILNRATDLLNDSKFETAQKDFLKARNKLTEKDLTGTIYECNNTVESLLKKILDLEKGQQSDLIKALKKSTLIPDYYEGFCSHFFGLLQSLFTIANQSGRHGKKTAPENHNELTYSIASFLLHLTGTFIVFIIERYNENSPNETSEPKKTVAEDDDLPF